MLKESSSVITGNDRYEGFAIDIIQEMSKMLGFNYTFEVQADNVYGSFNNITMKWNGMLGKIIDGVSKCNILPRYFFFHFNQFFSISFIYEWNIGISRIMDYSSDFVRE